MTVMEVAGVTEKERADSFELARIWIGDLQKGRSNLHPYEADFTRNALERAGYDPEMDEGYIAAGLAGGLKAFQELEKKVRLRDALYWIKDSYQGPGKSAYRFGLQMAAYNIERAGLDPSEISSWQAICTEDEFKEIVWSVLYDGGYFSECFRRRQYCRERINLAVSFAENAAGSGLPQAYIGIARSMLQAEGVDLNDPEQWNALIPSLAFEDAERLYNASPLDTVPFTP